MEERNHTNSISRCFLGVFVLYLILTLGLFLIICGFYFFLLPNERQKRIDKFNQYVYTWNSRYIFDMKEFGADFEKEVFVEEDNPLEIDTSHSIDHGSLFQWLDDPPPQAWSSHFFSKTKDYGQVHYDYYAKTIGLEGESVLFETRNDFIEVNFNKFHRVSQYLHSSESRRSNRASAIRHCVLSGGSHKRTPSGMGDKCVYYYRLSKVCVLLDPKTQMFSNYKDESQVYPTKGCYKNQQFYDGDGYFLESSEDYPSAYYELFSLEEMDTKTFPNFEIQFEVRSFHDPEVRLNYLTDGMNDFGMSSTKQRVIGGVVIVLGMSTIVFICTLFCCCFVLSYLLKPRD